jgi:hypothetical protein
VIKLNHLYDSIQDTKHIGDPEMCPKSNLRLQMPVLYRWLLSKKKDYQTGMLEPRPGWENNNDKGLGGCDLKAQVCDLLVEDDSPNMDSYWPKSRVTTVVLFLAGRHKFRHSNFY